MDPFWRFTQQSALSPPALATSILFMALDLGQTVHVPVKLPDQGTRQKAKNPYGNEL